MKKSFEKKQKLQDDLMELIDTRATEFLDGEEVNAAGLSEDEKSDILVGAMLTLFASHMANIAAEEGEQSDDVFEAHLEECFTAVTQLFWQLKSKITDSQKNTESPKVEEKLPKDKKKKSGSTVH